MAASPPPSDPKAPASGAVDGITPAAPATPPVSPATIEAKPLAGKKTPTALRPEDLERKRVSQLKRILILVFGILYGAFALWSLFLLAVLPSAEDQLRALIPLGLLSSGVAVVALLLLGFFLFIRVSKSDISVRARQFGLLKVLLMILPGLALGIMVPLAITREPGLSLDVVDPKNASDFVAPLSVTISAARAADTLKKLKFNPVKYQWDTNADGKMDQETVVPQVTTVIDRAGVYVVAVTILLDGNQQRTVALRITVPTAVFSTSPLEPVVERPVKFSVANLLSDPKLFSDVTWNFGDASKEENTKLPDNVHTYYTTDTFTVTAVVKLTNNTEQTFTRNLTVIQQPALPFAATLSTEPKTLVGPVPLGIVFTVDTDEPLKDIQWDFGEGTPEPGKDLKRVSHLFSTPGIYPVSVRLRNNDGKIAELSALVRATDVLQLTDLKFEGQPEVNGAVLRGEVPLTVDLTPKTGIPLVQFSWEDENGPVAPATPGSPEYQQIYRKEGSYPLILIGEDAEGKAFRMPLTVQVDPPSPDPQISIRPEGGPAPLLVDLDASSTFVPPGQEIAGFEWTFGDEGPNDKPFLGAAHVQHTYKQPGEYSIQLRVVMVDGKDYKATRKIVVRLPTLSSCFTASRTTVAVGKGVDFDSSCTAGTPSSYLWDIRGDQNPDLPLGQSQGANYSFVFDSPGTYHVSLTIQDAFGNKDTKTSDIIVTP